MNLLLYITLCHTRFISEKGVGGKTLFKECFNCSDSFLTNSFDDGRKEWETSFPMNLAF